MPRKRTERNRDEKVREILDAGERQLFDGGFEALSIAAIARELSIAANTVYWYFPSRADLFVAILRRRLEAAAARKPRGELGVVERILWWTDEFAALYAFQGALQRQAAESKAVAKFARDLDSLLKRMLTNAFRDWVPDEELAVAIDSFRATVTGTYAQGLPRARRRRVLEYALDTFRRGGSGARPR